MHDFLHFASPREAKNVLIFVCLPLSLALLVAVLFRVWTKPKLSIVRPDFSLKIEHLGRGAALVIYSRQGKTWHFEAELLRGKQIAIRIPPETEPEAARCAREHLASALEELGYRYVVV